MEKKQSINNYFTFSIIIRFGNVVNIIYLYEKKNNSKTSSTVS